MSFLTGDLSAVEHSITQTLPSNCDELNVNLFPDDNTDCAGEEKLATFLRIRPVENLCHEESPYEVVDSTLLSVDLGEKNDHRQKKAHSKKRLVKFTEIFDETSTQQMIFTRCCIPLVNEVINGTNALLFCYGTTSSGKSYTMRGPPDDPTSDPGLIPLALKKLFEMRKFIDVPLIGKSKFCDTFLLDQDQQAVEMEFKSNILNSNSCRNISAFCANEDSTLISDDGYENICYLSYFEIYNGFIYDLLVPTSGGRGQSLLLFADDKQRYFVKDLKSVMASSLTEALQIYSFGWTNLQRNIQETGLNKNSSRSHSFLIISVIKFKEDKGMLLESQVSHLTFGDLAGSERQNKTHSEGLRVKEGGNINKSLMHLKECFNQTRESQKNPAKNTIIQFRNSPLTKFFQPYLTGTGRAWMIININPSPVLLPETLGCLDFGETASHISINSTYHLEESKRRITQLMLKSSSRWSSFDGKSKIPEIPEVIIEEDADLNVISPDTEVIIKEVEKIYADLEKKYDEQMKAANELYERSLDARLELQKNRSQKIIDEMKEEIQELNTDKKELNEKIASLTEELTNLKNQKNPLEEELELQKERTQKIIDELKEEIQGLNGEKKELNEKILSLTEELTNLKNQRSQLEEELGLKMDSLTNQLTDAQKEIQDLNADKKESSEKISSLTEELTNLKNQRSQLEEELRLKMDNLTSQLTDAQKEIQELNTHKKELNEKISSLTEELLNSKNQTSPLEEELELQKNKSQKIIDEMKKEIQKLNADKNDSNEKITSLTDELTNLKNQKNNLEKELELKMHSLTNQLNDGQKEIEVLNGEKKELNEKISSLTEELTNLKNQTSSLGEELESKKERTQKIIDELKKEISELNGEKKELNETILRITEELTNLKNQRKEDVQSKEQQEVAQSKIVQESEEKISKLTEQLSEVKKENIELKEKKLAEGKTIQELEEKVVTLSNELGEVKSKNDQLEEQLKISEIKVIPRSDSHDSSNQLPTTSKSSHEIADKLLSAKKRAREITIDANYLPEIAGWTKKKNAESTSCSPSIDVTSAYLKRFQGQSTAKKSVVKSARKPTRKSTRRVSKSLVQNDVQDESFDELGNLLKSSTKPKKKKSSKDDEEEKVPLKRKKLPLDDAQLDTLSPHFEDDEPKNVKGGRVLRPRRQIKF